MGARRAAWIALAVLVLAVLVLLVILVPWRVAVMPGGATVPDAARDFRAAEVSRSAALAAGLQPTAMFSLAASLAISAALGLISSGARIVTALASPLGGGWVDALDLTRGPAAFVEMQRRLGVRHIADLDPNRLYYWVFASHPSITERIAVARDRAEINRVAVP